VIGVSPVVNSGKKYQARPKILDKSQLAPHLCHHQSGVEDISKQVLLVRRREVLDLAAHARRDFLTHYSGKPAKDKAECQVLHAGGQGQRVRCGNGQRVEDEGSRRVQAEEG
jgi:hypothetical protein